MSRVLQKDAEQESQMRAEIQGMKQELSTVNMMDEFARYARLERKINKMTDKLKTHGTVLSCSLESFVRADSQRSLYMKMHSIHPLSFNVLMLMENFKLSGRDLTIILTFSLVCW